MRKPILAVSVTALFLAVSCKHAKTGVTPSSTPGSPKTVTIRVTPDPARPGFFKIAADPDSVNISKRGHEIIKWCVDFASPSDDTLVHIGGFVKEGDPSRKDPFGTLPTDNVFDIAHFDFRCRVKSKEAAPDAMGAYKYNIVFKVRGEDRGNLDPRVIIGD
ncbi:MAG TPA: hypothetical protein VKM94_17250 [Blastocatellia bacterium]|nr:hypothetical protein [Blastocatellia bacterium]